MNNFFQLVSVIFIFIAILLVTYLTTRWVAKIQRGQYAGRNVELIDAGQLSTNKYIQIVRVGKKYLILAICKDSVTSLGEISEEDLNLANEGQDSYTENESFRKILEKTKNMLPHK